MDSFVRVTLSNVEHGERFAFGIWGFGQLIGLANINVDQYSGCENGIGSVGYCLDKDFRRHVRATRCVETLGDWRV
jgi:RimJ/RimL family protein N-acetyltransferase